MLTVQRRTMQDAVTPARVELPSGATREIEMQEVAPGRFEGVMEASELGLYRVRQDELSAVAAAGPLNPREIADMRATDALIRPLAAETGGGIWWTGDGAAGVPAIRAVRAGQDALARIIATLPDPQARQASHRVMRSWRRPATRPPVKVDVSLLRNACWEERGLRIRYHDLNDRTTEREIWPLGMSYSDNTLLLLAFCLLRQDFRLFHVYRILSAQESGGSFRPRRVTLLNEFRRHALLKWSAAGDRGA